MYSKFEEKITFRFLSGLSKCIGFSKTRSLKLGFVAGWGLIECPYTVTFTGTVIEEATMQNVRMSDLFLCF